MKKLVIVGLVLLIVAGTVFAQQRGFVNGNRLTGQGVSYNATTNTPNGTITVQVRVQRNSITEVNVTNATDSEPFVQMTLAAMLPAFRAAQSVQAIMAVDLVTGATYTARGLREAVANAVRNR